MTTGRVHATHEKTRKSLGDQHLCLIPVTPGCPSDLSKSAEVQLAESDVIAVAYEIRTEIREVQRFGEKRPEIANFGSRPAPRSAELCARRPVFIGDFCALTSGQRIFRAVQLADQAGFERTVRSVAATSGRVVARAGPVVSSLPIRLSPTATSGSVRPCSWTFTSVAIFGSHNRCQSSSDFSLTMRPVPATWRRLAGATGSFAPIVRRRESRSASQIVLASCAAASAAVTPD